jgi:hypothetical protein
MSTKQQENNKEIDTAFFELVDSFIRLANQYGRTNPIEDVGAAIRYAAARYNSYEVASKSDDLKRDKESALEWFTGEYKKMLTDNIDYHIENPPQK